MLRRDPALWSRTPIHRSTQSTLRPSRCFSKSSPALARHNDESDDHGGKKPEGMSDIDWMRQRHLRRWRKRIEEDPYRALFGASEDMLRGRGLEGYIQRQREMHKKGLDWVQKAFPKWMLEDMGLRDGGKSTGVEEKVGDGSPKKTKIGTDQDAEVEKREELFRKPSYRSKTFERDVCNEGVKSPSDSRRPHEQPLNSFQSPGALHEDIVQGLRKNRRIPEERMIQEQASVKTSDVDITPSPELAPKPTPAPGNNVRPTKTATAPEPSFVDEFLAEQTLAAAPLSSEPGSSTDWRQTALERRVAQGFPLTPRRKTDVPFVDVTAKDKARNGNNYGHEQDVRPPTNSKNASHSSTGQAVIDFNGTSSSRLGRKEVEEFDSRVEDITEEVMQTPSLTNVPETPGKPGSTTKSKFSPYPRIKTDDWVVPSSKDTWKEFEGFTDVKLGSFSTESVRFGRAEPDTSAKPESTTKSKLSPFPRIKTDDWVVPSSKDASNVFERNKDDKLESFSTESVRFGRAHPENSANPRKSTSEVLKQLPKDDIDFLTADNVRASMGRTKGHREDRTAVRQKLEEDFSKDTPEIDPMLEARVMNDQYVRRKTSEMTAASEQTTPAQSEPSKIVSEQKTDDPNSKPVSILGTSFDLMSRWLYNGGNVLAQHFWQDPVQLVAGQLSHAEEEFLKGIGTGVLKGRRAFASIKDELVEDIPAAKELVDRLNRNEIRASAGAVRLYRELPSALKDMSDADASKAATNKRIGKLRQELLDTEKQYKKAREAVKAMENASNPSFLQRKRLRYASDVLRKNAKLTRMAIFGLQARIEVEAGNSGGLVARELLHRLLTLQDTQLALSKLVLRAIHVLKIDIEAEEEVSTKTVGLSDPSVVEALASVAAKDSPTNQGLDAAAANEILEDEVSKQKAAMQGLSDDGYKHPPKLFIRKSFEGPNPLAHSLFRPFGLQLESLGKDVDAAEDSAANAAKREKADRDLVKEVKKAYEDTYGPITVDHWQVPPAEKTAPISEGLEEVSEAETIKRQPSVQMLKEDEVSPTFTGEADSGSVPKDHAAVTKSAAEVETVSTKDANPELAKFEDLQPLSTSDPQPDNRESSESLKSTKVERNVPISPLKETKDILSPIYPGDEYSYDSKNEKYVPVFYKTLIYNAETDKLSITTSRVPQPNPSFTSIPLHEALATLSHPAKFVDHLPESFFVISVKPDVLSVRTASRWSKTAEKCSMITAEKPSIDSKADTEEAEGWKGINPVDGTTTLSPTGFVSVGSDLDRDFAERRRKADEYHKEVNKSKQNTGVPDKKRKGRVGAGGVVKTAIWAGAFCYIVGVAAEVAKTPF